MKLLDLTGQTFSRLTVIERSHNVGKAPAWLCQCSCGSQLVVIGSSLRSGNTRSCGCLRAEECSKKLTDLKGKTFGYLTVIKRAPNAGKQTTWLCQCDCGNTTTVRAHSLSSGETKSCGCKTGELVARARGKPNRKTRAYSIWTNIKTRCRNPNNAAYPDYGERGIDICDEWADSFDAFFAAVGEPPTPKHEIDRIDNDKGYQPGNVRYVTRKVNANNKRRSVKLTFNGATHTVPEWAALLGISPNVIHTRLRAGWLVERILTTPVRKRN